MIPKADRDADAAILAAATQGAWTAVPRTSQEGLMVACTGPMVAGCEDARQATSIRVERPGSIGDMAHAEARMPWEQHAANAKAAAHAVNRLPEYIANAAEMEAALAALVATLPRCDGAIGDDNALPCCKPGQRQPAMWGGNELMWCDGHHAAGYGEEQLPHATAARTAISLLRGIL